MTELTEHQLGQRQASTLALLDDLGDAEQTETSYGPRSRIVYSSVSTAAAARFEYTEVYERGRDSSWTLARYYYEYRPAPRPSRRAHHRHAPWGPHAHCVGLRDTRGGRHFRDVEVDVFEAHAEFLRLYASGAPLDCGGLFPLRRG